MRMSGRRVAAALTILLVLCQVCCATAFAGPAAVSSARMRQLVADAADGDTSSLAQLRQVQEVDGERVDVDAALSGASAADLRTRLGTMAASLGTGARDQPSPGSARVLAGALTANQSVHPVSFSDPLTSLLRRLHLHFSFSVHGLSGLWGVAAVIVLLLAGLGARRAIRRRGSLPDASSLRPGREREDPQALQREAEAAEQRGAFAESIRLRFRAGLLLLGAGSAIDYRPSLLTGEVARTLRSEQFDALAASFERVAYRDQSAGPDEAAAAAEGWRRLLGGRGRAR